MNASKGTHEPSEVASELRTGKLVNKTLVGGERVVSPFNDSRPDYENDRRAGNTHPEMIEIISSDDPRHAINRGRSMVLNRVEKRARGWRNNRTRSPFKKSVKAFRGAVV
jgi:hypothetical protein